MTVARVLARTGAVLHRIDDALADPFPAAVARLAGVQGSYWWGCVHDEVVTIGSLRQPYLWTFYPDERPRCADAPILEHGDGDFGPRFCWADHGDEAGCGRYAATDLGLCAHHHAEIVGVAGMLEHLPPPVVAQVQWSVAAVCAAIDRAARDGFRLGAMLDLHDEGTA